MCTKIYLFGEKGSGTRIQGKVQDFYKLRSECLTTKTLFEDPNFPAEDSSLFYKQKNTKFDWKRPYEICKNPQLFAEGISRFDVKQGLLGNCWQVSAVATLTLNEKLFCQVVPTDQGFKNYAGIFHFRFWQYGKWVDVVIDDRLPVYKGTRTLAFMKSSNKREFWSSLLEKAYAKLHGSYEALIGGNITEAMQDLTGGLTEDYTAETAPENLFDVLLKAYERRSLIGCTLNYVESKGLYRDHAYSITDVRYVKVVSVSDRVPLLRLRNPWGCGEWTGDWSDQSSKWDSIIKSETNDLDLIVKDDGEFWIAFEDFKQYFQEIEICNLDPNYAAEEEKKWEVQVFEGQWIKGVTAGGSWLERPGKFCCNPQYQITVAESDEKGDGKCTVIIALLQKYRRAQRCLGLKDLIIGYEIYNLSNTENAPKPLNLPFIEENRSLVTPMALSEWRELCRRFRMRPGTYCIIPYSLPQDTEGEFLLRVFSERRCNMEFDKQLQTQMDQLEREENLLTRILHTAVHDERLFYNPPDVNERVKNRKITADEIRELDFARKLFLKYEGEDGGINWMKLKNILERSMYKSFTKETCRSMIAMLDTDRSGELNFQEFQSLWSDIQDWKKAFELHYEKKSGTLYTKNLRHALNSAGYHVNFNILNILVRRYTNEHGQFELEEFLMCAIKLKTMIDIFTACDSKNINSATFTLENWMECTLYS